MISDINTTDINTSKFFYFTLLDGKPGVTTEKPADHSWLWKHDYSSCSNSHLCIEEHKSNFMESVKKRKLVDMDGFLVPHYSSLQTYQVGLYHNSEYLILSTQCGRNFSFYLVDGIIPDDIKENLSDDKFIQRYINENAEQLYSVLPSKVVSLRTFDIHTPKHDHADSTYHYHIYELNDLLGERPLYYVEVNCRHNNRIYYAYRNENIARRFVKDFNSSHFSFCNR